MMMLGLVLLVMVPPVLALGLPLDPLFSASPLVRIWTISSGGPSPLPPLAWSGSLATSVVALSVWMLAHRISGSALADPDGLR